MNTSQKMRSKTMDKTIEYYNLYAEDYVNTTQSVDFRLIQERFLSALKAAFPKVCKKDIRILDLGCGSGRDSRYFLGQGYDVSALDGSEALCRYAAAYAGIPVQEMRFEDFHEISCYEGIWACASILHLSYKELKEVLSNIYEALVPNGIFYTSFKYGVGEKERGNRHFTDMTEESLGELLKEVTGFRVTDEGFSGDVRPGREAEGWLNIILQKE